jgi:hypothetical protein
MVARTLGAMNRRRPRRRRRGLPFILKVDGRYWLARVPVGLVTGTARSADGLHRRADGLCVTGFRSFHEVRGRGLDGSHTVHEAVPVRPDGRNGPAAFGSSGKGVGQSLGHPVERAGMMDGVAHRGGVTHGGADTAHVPAERLHE